MSKLEILNNKIILDYVDSSIREMDIEEAYSVLESYAGKSP